MNNPKLLAWVFLILLGIIWGGSFLAVAFALPDFGPATIAAIRIAMGALLVTAMSFLLGHGLPTPKTVDGRKTLLFAFGMALTSNALPFTLLGWAQQEVSSGYAGITMAVVPLLVLPFSHFLIPSERLTLLKTIGFVLGFIGVVILIGPKSILDSGGGDDENLARIACVVAACCYAIGSIFTRLSPKGPLLAFSSAALIFATILMIPYALVTEGLPVAYSIQGAVAILYLGIFPTAIATAMLVYVIKTAGPPFMSLVNYMVPVWAVVFGIAFRSEAFPKQFLGALLLILLGLAVSQIRPTWFQRRNRADQV